MKRFILACLLAVPFTTMANHQTEAQEAARKTAPIPETAKFGHDYAEIEYSINGVTTMVACGTINAKNAAGKYIGEHIYMVTFFKSEERTVPTSVATFHPSKLSGEMSNVLNLPDDHPKKVVMEGYAKCVVKMLDQPPREY